MGLSTARRTATMVALISCSALQVAHIVAPPATFAQAQSMMPGIQEGERHFREERYLEAIEALRNALQNPSTGTQDRIRALRIIAQSSVRMSEAEQAKTAFCEIRKLDPTWVPDPTILLPEEIAVFEQSKATCIRSRGPVWKNPWVLGGTGIGAVALVLLLGGSSSGNGPSGPLPEPPLPPD